MHGLWQKSFKDPLCNHVLTTVTYSNTSKQMLQRSWRCSESRWVSNKLSQGKYLDGCGTIYGTQGQEVRMEGTPLPSPEGCWVPSLDHPGSDRPRACMDADFLLSLPEASPVFPWPQGAVSPFPLLPRLASSFSFASSASPNYSLALNSKMPRVQL